MSNPYEKIAKKDAREFAKITKRIDALTVEIQVVPNVVLMAKTVNHFKNGGRFTRSFTPSGLSVNGCKAVIRHQLSNYEPLIKKACRFNKKWEPGSRDRIAGYIKQKFDKHIEAAYQNIGPAICYHRKHGIDKELLTEASNYEVKVYSAKLGEVLVATPRESVI